MKHHIPCLLSTWLLLNLLLPNSVPADTFPCPSGYDQIFQALAVASPGDTVLVSNHDPFDPDEAYKPFSMESGKKVLAVSGQNPIIDGADSVAITVDWPETANSNTILRGFTIRGGAQYGAVVRDYGMIKQCAVANDSSQYYVGISSSGNTTIDSCIVTTSGTDNVGIFHSDGVPTLTHCEINVSDGQGMHIFCPSLSTGGEISDCLITMVSGTAFLLAPHARERPGRRPGAVEPGSAR